MILDVIRENQSPDDRTIKGDEFRIPVDKSSIIIKYLKDMFLIYITRQEFNFLQVSYYASPSNSPKMKKKLNKIWIRKKEGPVFAHSAARSASTESASTSRLEYFFSSYFSLKMEIKS
jgi:hypothetical protein